MTAAYTTVFLFDFDKNIMKVQVPFVLTRTSDGAVKEMSGSEYMQIKDRIGKADPWTGWSDADAMRYYRDQPGVPAEDQSFVQQIRAAIDSGDPASWQSPSWGMFVHACDGGRPIVLVTARGHSDATVRAGFRVLKDAGFLRREPQFLALWNVTYPPAQAALGFPQGSDDVQELKRVAIVKTVELAVAKYGADRPHRFGMSDDTMANVEFCADAMRQCKERYPHLRFFVISTNKDHLLKAEIFPFNVPVDGHGDTAGPGPLHTHGDA